MKRFVIPLVLAAWSSALAGPGYRLHEWGTFTTVSGSDGVLLDGLEREEEPLPKFVHTHFGLENGQDQRLEELLRLSSVHGTYGFGGGLWSKGMPNRPLAGVTVKMETPVIYFHSEDAFHAKVEVGFEGGTISQWYPGRSGGETLPEPPPPADPVANPTPLADWIIDFSKGHRGSVEWDVDVLSRADSEREVLFKPHDSLGWTRARVPGANVVRTSSGETEGYLFYRGIGHFDPGLKIIVDPGETLHLENGTGGHIPYLVIVERAQDGGLRWKELSGLGAKAGFGLPETGFKAEPAGFCEPLYRAMKAGLMRCGLSDDEARAMVETWWHSYFEAPGLRVFWVLPRQTTDRILPLKVTPEPGAIVRVLVGRSEIIRPREERAWLAMSAPDSKENAIWKQLVANDRFGKAIEARVKALQVR